MTRTVERPSGDGELPFIGNGLLGYRMAPNPLLSTRAYASGFVKLHEEGHFETWAGAPFPLALDFRLGVSPSMVEMRDSVVVHSQSLDMSCGEFTTEMEFPLGGGTAKCKVMQFASRTSPTLVCQELELELPKDGELTVIAFVIQSPDTTPANDGIPNFQGGVADVSVAYSAGGYSTCGVSALLDFGREDVRRDPWTHWTPEPRRAFHLDVSGDRRITIRTIASTVSSEYHHQPNLESCRLVNMGAAIGFNKLRESNRRAWAEIWKSRVKVIGDERAQEYLDCSLFYVYSTAHPCLRTSIPPFGPSSGGYSGHIFWDTETYVMPTLLLTCPDAARATLDFRVRHLDAARKRASSYGYAGAMYPWEQDGRGFESTTSNCSTGWLEQHVNLCVAVAVWQYAQATGDADWMATSAWPVLRAVAEWVVSRVEKTERGYEFLTVTSAAEGYCINNSSYVNALCAQALRFACDCARALGHEPDRRWAAVAGSMYIPIGPMPGFDGDVIYMHDGGFEEVAPTDSAIIGFPFDLPFELQDLRRTFAYCMKLRFDGLNMGHAFFAGEAAFIGSRELARQWFDCVIDDMWEQPWGMGTEHSTGTETCFVTTMGAMLQSAMMAFTGLRFEPAKWTKYEACLPKGWERIEVDRIYLEGECYSLVAEHGKKAILTRVDP